jgi:chemotaxis protein methyltransferase CheR
MNAKLPDLLISSLRTHIHANLGLNFSVNSEKEMIRKIEYAAKAFGYSNPAHFVEWLLANKLTVQQTGALASHLTIGETYFFREMKGFDYLGQIYLPGIIQKRIGTDKRLRIWCAGCATGEEAYSLAIVLLQSIPDIHLWDVSILATDVNSAFLEKARKGIYTKWSFRSKSETFISKYFTAGGLGEYQILPRIKKMVTFAQLNLAEESYPSPSTNTTAIDIIFCRNVLIYFSPEGARAVTSQLYESLVAGGILVVSPVEVSGMISPKFNKINYTGFTIFHKAELNEDLQRHPLRKPHIIQQYQMDPVPEKMHRPASLDDDQTGLKRLKELLPPEQLTEIHPAIDVACLQAQQYYEEGFFTDAEIILNGLITNNNQANSTTLSLLAKTKAHLGKLSEAKNYCEQALKYDKLDPGLHYFLATVMQELGDDEKAIELLNKALYLDNEFVLAHFLLGTLNVKSGNHKSGKKSYNNALKSLSRLHPEDTLPESDGITVGRFSEILNSITNDENKVLF